MISIITICFNNLDDVKRTCASVDMQALKPYEHIIIDGSTKPDIKNYLDSTPQPPYRKWICERDNGISDAFNKGIRNAKGEITTLLNSGDTLYDATVLEKVAATMYVRKELYDRHGMFDTSLKLAMDYDFLCRIADEKFTFIDYPLATFDPTGVSSTGYIKAMKESYAQYRKYYGHSLKQTLWGWRLTAMHHLLESNFGKFLYKVKVKMGKENV